jgi:mono/diheme cytochrome c family protein
MRRWLPLLVLVAAVGAVAAWFISAPRPLYARENWRAYEDGGDAARGRVMFMVGGCESCHKTPGQADPLRLGGGYELKTPFGSFFPPNISPDEHDGIGQWKVVDLANALLAGVSPAGEHYYPALPYTSYSHMTFEDVRDLMTFLRTLPAVQGRAPPHRLSFPFNVRRGLGFWKLLYLRGGAPTPDPSQSAEWNRGRYLVEGPGHCAECHSPRDFAGGIVASRRFAGGLTADGKHKVPNITQGGPLAKWSKSDIETVLSTGFTPEGDSLGGDMAAVVRNLAQAPPADISAMAEFIKSLPAIPSAGK